MVKRYANLALIYGIAAMAFGVFYREFTKFSHFSGKTNLSVMHTHYFLLGMFFFLMLIVIEKVFAFSYKRSDPGVGNTADQENGCFDFRDCGDWAHFNGRLYDYLVDEDSEEGSIRRIWDFLFTPS